MIGCIALYDFDISHFKLKEWVEYGEEWMTGLGYPSNTMGLPHSGKFLLYKNGKRRLEKENYAEIKKYVHFYGGGEAGTNYGWKISTCYHGEEKTLHLCFDEETMTFSYDFLEKLLKDLGQFCSPHYGIGFLREKKYGPDYYALGYSHGLKMAYQNPEHGKESERIYCWRTKYHRPSGTYQTGDLRDVYPFNVLCQAHLDRDVNGQRFEEWVKASPERGQLKQVTDSLWTWWVEADHIPAVREALAPSGMILCL